MLGAVAGQPAGDLAAEGSGPAGDERGTREVPGPGPGGRAEAGPVQSAYECTRGPDRQLVLVPGAAERAAEHRSRARVQCRGQVDETAPPVGVFQRGDPAHAPGHGLLRTVQRVGGAHLDRTSRGAPQRRRHPGLAQRLEQRDGGGVASRHVGEACVRRVVQGEQRQDALDAGGQVVVGEQVAVQFTRVDGDGVGAGAVGGQGLQASEYELVLVVALGDDHQPIPGETARGGFGHRAPGHFVAPVVDR